MQCGVDGCPFRVVRDGGNWAHVDTHGVMPGHAAVPTGYTNGPKGRSLEERLVEYRDNLLSIRAQFLLGADTLDKRGHDGTELREGAKFYGLIAEDLTKIINGEELKPFVVSGVV